MRSYLQIFKFGGIITLALGVCGCQTNAARVLEFRIEREDDAPSESRRLGAEGAVTLLREIAEDLKHVVKGPRDVGGAWIEYNTEPLDPERWGEATVKLFIDQKAILFVVDKSGTAEDFQEAREVGDLLTARLEQLKIPFKTESRAAWFWGP